MSRALDALRAVDVPIPPVVSDPAPPMTMSERRKQFDATAAMAELAAWCGKHRASIEDSVKAGEIALATTFMSVKILFSNCQDSVLLGEEGFTDDEMKDLAKDPTCKCLMRARPVGLFPPGPDQHEKERRYCSGDKDPAAAPLTGILVESECRFGSIVYIIPYRSVPVQTKGKKAKSGTAKLMNVLSEEGWYEGVSKAKSSTDPERLQWFNGVGA